MRHLIVKFTILVFLGDLVSGEEIKNTIEDKIPILHEDINDFPFLSPEIKFNGNALDSFEYDIAKKLLDDETLFFMEKIRKHFDGLFTMLAANESIRNAMTNDTWCGTNCSLLTLDEASSARKAKDALIFKSFSDDRCGPEMTGYVGPASGKDTSMGAKRRIIEVVTEPGANTREIFGLLYCSTKDEDGFDGLDIEFMQSLLRFSLVTGISYGKYMNVAVTKARFEEIDSSKNSDSKLNYMPDIYVGNYNSWTRFLFDWPGKATTTSKQRWKGVRTSKGYCNVTTAKAKDVIPALSDREIKSQGCTSVDTCKLKWYPGRNCYVIHDVANYTDDHGRTYPSYTQIAHKFGYRIVAGPSGTTAAYMQIFSYLNFSPQELVKLRKALIAWMVPTNDHSIFEILLSSESYMPPGESMTLANSSIIALMIKEADDSDDSSSSEEELKLWMLIAIVIMAVVCICIFIYVIYYCCYSKTGDEYVRTMNDSEELYD